MNCNILFVAILQGKMNSNAFARCYRVRDEILPHPTPTPSHRLCCLKGLLYWLRATLADNADQRSVILAFR